MANNTVAIQRYVVTANGGVLANVSVTYSIKQQECMTTGLKIAISGSVDWGQSQTGTISIPFAKSPLRTTAHAVWYGNQSGVEIGLDWSDSVTLHPSLLPSGRSLSYSVGRSFIIDPVIIVSNNNYQPGPDYSRYSCYSNGYYYVFYYYAAYGYWVYTSSPNEVAWSSPLYASVENWGLSVWCSGNVVYYAADSSGQLSWRYGVMNAGTITWAIPELLVAGLAYNAGDPYIALNSTGGIFVSDLMSLHIAKNTAAAAAGNWQTAGGSALCAYSYSSILVPLANGEMGCIYTSNYFFYPQVLCASIWTGPGARSWSTSTCTSASSYIIKYTGAVAIGNTIEVVASTGYSSPGNIYYLTFSGGSWSNPVTLATSQIFASLSTDGSTSLYVFYGKGISGNGSTVTFISSTNAGESWTAPYTLSSSETDLDGIWMSYSAGGGLVSGDWLGMLSGTWDIRWASLPVGGQDAAASSKPWSKPGISPYESYFQGLTEYVSPGNGLLGIEQSDLNLPGRGIELNVGRVFSTPYSFLYASSPYLYDNYTLTNLGYGWSLNFPWMGKYDLHLTDGQSFAYSWSGSVFQFNSQTDFELVNNSGSYTLYLADGTQYQFNSAKQLTSETDSTGNNTISFSYGTNGYISQITDTISRVVTFSYNSNNTLSSISSGGRTVYYYYSGHHLSSVKDAAGRITTYFYSTGINSWLVSEVLYPTGGETTYAYGNALVGTEAETYYVTSRTIYSSPTQISQTDSVSYKVQNGQVVWSNTTISNGVSVQSIQDYYFQNVKNYMRLYDESANGTVTKITEYDYDSSGRINDTRIVSSLSYNMVGYWPLDEGTGSTTADASGYGNTGTLVDSPTWQTGASCVYGDCLSFTSSSDQYVNVPSSYSSNWSPKGSFTVSTWFKTTSTGTNPISDSGIAEDQTGWSLSASGQVQCRISNYYSTIVNSPSTYSDGKWHLVTCVFNAGQSLTLYVDGSQVASAATTLTSTRTYLPLTIGASLYPGSNGYFSGSIDDYRIYNSTLDASQIHQLYSETSPASPLSSLASSVTAYDNWGNVVYSQDNTGQQTWSAYANTNSQNTIPVVTNGLVGEWTLNQASGAAAYDSTGSGLTGTLVNGPSWQTSGCELADCLSFSSGSSQYVNLGSPSALQLYSSLTVAAWIRFTSDPASSQTILTSYNGNYLGYGLMLTSAGKVGFLIGGGTSTNYWVTSPSALSTSAWHLVIGTFDGSTQRLYVDGSLVVSGTASAASYSGQGVLIGYSTGGYLATYFNGKMNDIRLYSHALSPAEVSTLYGGTGFSAPFYTNDTLLTSLSNGYAGYWPLNEATGYLTADLSGNNNPGTLVNSPTWQTGTSCKYAGCLGFTSSSDQYVTIPSTLSISFPASTSSFTISFWMKISSAPSSTQALISKTGDCSSCSDTGYGVRIESGGALSGYLMNSGTVLGSASGSASISTGAWHNVVLVDNAGALTLYLDGSSYATGTATAGSIGNTNPLTIGSDGSNGLYFTGSLDDVRIYTHALSSGQVSALDSASTPPMPSGLFDVVVGQADWQNGVGNVVQETVFKYDSHGNLLTEKVSHNGAWLYTSYTYDRYGNRVTMTDPGGTVTHYHYSSTYSNAYLTLTSVMVGSQNVTQSYSYGSTTGYTLSETDGNGKTTSFSYDNLGRTTQITYPAIGGVSATTTYGYNDAGNYVTITNQNGNVVKQYYDGLARLTSVQTYNGSSLYSTESYTYNWDNEMATDTQPSGSVYTYSYNQDGQQIEVVNPDTTITTTSYNVFTNTKTVTDGNDHPMTFVYDWDGRLLSVNQYYSSTGYYTTSYTYDLSGNQLTTKDPNGATTSYKYDDLNRLVKTTYPDSSYQTQSYNRVGDMVGEVNAGGTQLNYTYDALNRLTQVSYPGGSTLAYTYDGDGNVLTLINSGVSTYYKYDALDRVTNETQVVSAHRYMVLYGYDKVGNVKSMVYPDATNVTMTYDFLNRVTKVGSLAKITYTTDSMIGKITYGDGETTTYTYNSMDRPSQVDMKTSAGVKELDLNYTYDYVGNVKTVGTERYSYNWLNELTSSGTPWPTTTYAYDPAGNMLNQTKVA